MEHQAGSLQQAIPRLKGERRKRGLLSSCYLLYTIHLTLRYTEFIHTTTNPTSVNLETNLLRSLELNSIGSHLYGNGRFLLVNSLPNFRLIVKVDVKASIRPFRLPLPQASSKREKGEPTHNLAKSKIRKGRRGIDGCLSRSAALRLGSRRHCFLRILSTNVVHFQSHATLTVSGC